MTIIETGFFVDTRGLSPDAVGRIRTAIAAEQVNPVVLGWSAAAAEEFMERLSASGSRVQYAAIREAAKAPQALPRTRIYEIAGWEEEGSNARSLRGFTRPINDLWKGMKAEGSIPQSAAVPLAPVYDGKVRGYQKAKSFEVPNVLKPLFA